MTYSLADNLRDAIFLILGKTGKFLNARGNRVCFIIEFCCLCYWLYTDINRGLYAQGISVFVSMGISIYGFRRWGRKQKEIQDLADKIKLQEEREACGLSIETKKS